MRARKMVLGGLIVVLLLSLVGCGGDSDDDKVLGNLAKSADLVINDKSPFYDPDKITIPQNREVNFSVFNEGKKIHNVTIPGFAIDVDVPPGEKVDIKIPATGAPRDGFFTMYCKYHQSDGEATKINISG